MKKKFYIIIILIVIILLTFIFLLCKIDNTRIDIEKEKSTEINSNIAIMLETSMGSGKYNISSSGDYPTIGYIFNSEKSKCENGSILSYNNRTKKVILKGIISDKCYAYFDKAELLVEYIIAQYTDGTNGLYYHDKNLASGAGDNSYRYSGTNPNNWVCFGTNSATCDNEHLYRIIGIFNEKIVDKASYEKRVKIIKAYEGTELSLGKVAQGTAWKSEYYKGYLENVPGYAWSGSTSVNSNNWLTSTLNTDTLNGTYLTKLGDWANRIALTEWNVGGSTYNNIIFSPLATTYQNEIISSAEIIKDNKKVGLMYASDYGFAASPENWTATLDSYKNDTNRENNWMFIGVSEWMVSRNSGNNEYAFYVVGNGNVYTYSVNDTLRGAIRPVLYLDSSLIIYDGSGTELDPYIIGV